MAAEVLSLEEEGGKGELTVIPSFLWEQIVASLDAVELHEVRRVVGEVLVQSLEDVYAEVRALREILEEFSASTDDMVSQAAEQQRILASPADGLLQQELRQLVSHLGHMARQEGRPEDALLPASHTKQRQTLDACLRESGDGRPQTASSESRESIRHLRGSRPGTASRPSTASRPGTGSVAGGSLGGGSRPQTARISPPGSSGGGGGGPSRPRTSDSVGRPETGASTASTSNATGGVVAEAVDGGRGGRGGAVIAQLRAALEEERRALLAQAEQLQLSIDDECEYREQSTAPPPSVPEMHQLKRALQESIARHEHAAHAPALRASLPRTERDRAFSRFAPLPPGAFPAHKAPPAEEPARRSSASRLRGLVGEAREGADGP